MKWSWKAFGLYLGASFGLGLLLSYTTSLVIDAKRGAGAPDSTSVSMVIGGFVASLLLAGLGGWKRWNAKPLIAAGMISSAVYAGNPGLGILMLPCAAALYYAGNKVQFFLSFHFSREVQSTGGPEPEQAVDSESEA